MRDGKSTDDLSSQFPLYHLIITSKNRAEWQGETRGVNLHSERKREKKEKKDLLDTFGSYWYGSDKPMARWHETS